MIQRIQSAYLLLSAVLLLIAAFIPFADFAITNNNTISLDIINILKNNDISSLHLTSTVNITIFVLNIFILVINIFLFKKRKLQMKICIISILLLIAYEVYLFWYIAIVAKLLKATSSYNISVALPVLSVVFVILAYLSINKDEKLVRSLNRIR